MEESKSTIKFSADQHNGCYIDSDDPKPTYVESEKCDCGYIISVLSEGFDGVETFEVSKKTAQKINDLYGIYTRPSSGHKITLD